MGNFNNRILSEVIPLDSSKTVFTVNSYGKVNLRLKEMLDSRGQETVVPMREIIQWSAIPSNEFRITRNKLRRPDSRALLSHANKSSSAGANSFDGT